MEIKNRPLASGDLEMLQKALDQDEYDHLSAESYTMDGAYSEVYEDEEGPIGVLRYTKSLRLTTVWCNNKDRVRNGASVIKAINDAVEKAKKNGFTEVLFNTDSPLLAKFCVDKLGFQENRGQYVKYI